MSRLYTPSVVLFSLLLCLIGFESAGAHPNGTSKITIRLLESDSITVTVDVNTDDILYALGTDLEYGEFDTVKIGHYQKAAVHYMQTRLNLLVDNRALADVRVRQWKIGGQGPDDDLTGDSAAFWDT